MIGLGPAFGEVGSVNVASSCSPPSNTRKQYLSKRVCWNSLWCMLFKDDLRLYYCLASGSANYYEFRLWLVETMMRNEGRQIKPSNPTRSLQAVVHQRSAGFQMLSKQERRARQHRKGIRRSTRKNPEELYLAAEKSIVCWERKRSLRQGLVVYCPFTPTIVERSPKTSIHFRNVEETT